MAVLLFLAGTRDRAVWQWLTLAAGIGSAVVLLLYMPFTYSGGGGPVGNRYFSGVYPRVPVSRSGAAACLQQRVHHRNERALHRRRSCPTRSTPRFNPGEHARSASTSALPVELTLVNDLPVNLSPARTRQPLGGTPPVFAYFLDDNIYNREGDAFWIRGESTGELAAAGADRHRDHGAGVGESIAANRASGSASRDRSGGNRVRVATGAETRVVDMPASSQQSFVLEMPRGFRTGPTPRFPTNYVYAVSIHSESGFIPFFQTGANDTRYLGVMVRLVPIYE